MIDLRSDTVTRPTPAMLAAMATADLGDDVLDGDPTTQRLEARAAALVGQEAALFVPSGTQANLIAVLTHGRPGDEIVLDRDAHVLNFENNGLTALAGCLPLPVAGERGHLTAELLAATLGGLVPRGPGPTLAWIENSANLAGGTVLGVAESAELIDQAHQAGLKVHIDGARLWNAAVSLGVSGAALAGAADSVSFCLSKGLSCPVGSLLCGSAEFVAVARERRRLVGGALRQSGVLAACGLVALDTMIERLAEDHAHARRLAIGLAELDCLELDPATVETNIVWFRCDDADWPARCQAAGLRLVSLGGGRCRMVTHAGVGPAEVEQALAIAAQAAKR